MRTLPVLSPAQVRHWDEQAAADGRPLASLMANAGRVVAQLIVERWTPAARRGVLVACGSGNNGGDGWVTAQALHVLGYPVWVTEIAPPPEGIAADARRQALHDGVRVVAADGPWPGIDLIVDALLGTGASGAPRPALMPLLARLIDLDRPVIAIDGPTGLDLGTGAHHGDLRARLTVTFGGARRGHLLARDEIGDLVVADIGLGAFIEAAPQLIDARWAAGRMQPFGARSHKGDRGRVVVIGGAPEMTGAARLAARAAFAAGAGLVHLVAPAESLETIRTAEPDLQTLAHAFEAPLSDELRALLQRADAVVIGPGLGRAPGRTAFVLALIEATTRIVLDADALHALRDVRDALARLATGRAILCTPHLGEFRALFPECSDAVVMAPWDAARDAARASGVAILLKGVPTVVADGEQWLTVAAGNPGLATGGSGDVLAGVSATLLAQGLDPAEAGAVAAQSLGEAADHAARRVTARAMRPMDVIAALPDVWRGWVRLPTAASRFPILWEAPAPIQR